MEEAKDLRQQASIADRQKLDEYLESVRDVQVRIARELNPPKASWVPVNEPDYKRPSDGIPRNRDEHLRLIIDLMVLALQTDTTRVGTLMTAHGFSRQNFSFLDGVSSDHHGMSHHKEQQTAVREYTQISRCYIEQFAYRLDRMRKIDEGNGRSLRDNSVVLYGSGMKDGNGHKKQNLPILLAGRGSGSLNPDRHVQLKQGTPLTNLHLTLLQKFDATITDFNGVSSTPIGELIS